jgi:hypothetical protein
MDSIEKEGDALPTTQPTHPIMQVRAHEITVPINRTGASIGGRVIWFSKNRSESNRIHTLDA